MTFLSRNMHRSGALIVKGVDISPQLAESAERRAVPLAAQRVASWAAWWVAQRVA
jgi:hypothetical protein